MEVCAKLSETRDKVRKFHVKRMKSSATLAQAIDLVCIYCLAKDKAGLPTSFI